jgi:hypothetical protein
MKLYKAALLLYDQEDNACDETKKITEETRHVLFQSCARWSFFLHDEPSLSKSIPAIFKNPKNSA